MYKTTTDESEILEYLRAEKVAFDIETAPDNEFRNDKNASLDAHKSYIVGISFSNAENSAIYVPFRHIVYENIEWVTAVNLLRHFANSKSLKIAHNLAFEAMFFYALGIVIQPPVADTLCMARLVNDGDYAFRKQNNGLKQLAKEMYGIDLPSFEETVGEKFFDELNPAEAITINYACHDADIAYRLYHTFDEWYAKFIPKHKFVAECIESPTSVFTGIMKYNGIGIDSELLKDKQTEIAGKIAEIKENIADIIGDVEIGSNASTSAFKKYLFQDLKLTSPKLTAKKQESADDDSFVILKEQAEKEGKTELVELFDNVQHLRKLNKIKSTYLDGYEKFINTKTKRIHPDFLQLGTDTGRFSCTNPNMQNCLRAGSDEIGVRNLIVADVGNVLLSVDMSQIELRLGAFYCRDEKMLETYQNGGDIHNQTADVVFGAKQHDKEERTVAKNVNFGIFYGIYPSGLQRTLKFKAGVEKTVTECEEFIANIKKGYPALAKWQKEIVQQTRRTRYSDTLFGRRRYLKNIVSKDFNERSFAERCAMNTPIQGTAADLLKLAMGEIVKNLADKPWLKSVLTIHDELVFELPKERLLEAVAFVKQAMETKPTDKLDVPLIAEASFGERFGGMKGVTDENQ